MAPERALILVGHGTRLPRGRRALGRLAASVRQRWDGPVHLCFVDVQPPTPLRTLLHVGHADVAEEGAIVLVPALLSTGFHVKVDIPEAIAEFGSEVEYAPPLGPSAEIAEILAGLVRDCGSGTPPSVLLAATGSSDPAAATDVREQARLITEALDGVPVSVGFASAGEPSLSVALAQSPPGTVVASYLLAPGFFADKIAAAAAARGLTATAPLLDAGQDAVEAICSLVIERAKASVR